MAAETTLFPPQFRPWVVTGEYILYTDKKEEKIFLVYKEIQKGTVARHIWLTASSYMTNICAFPHILGSPSSYMTLQPLPSEFPYTRGKLYFLFYQCNADRKALTHVLFMAPASLFSCFYIQNTAQSTRKPFLSEEILKILKGLCQEMNILI
jgi:hypothetical protein